MSDADGRPGPYVTKRPVSDGAENQLYVSHASNGTSVQLWDYKGTDERIIRAATAGRGLTVLPSNIEDPDFLENLVAKRLKDPFMFGQLKLRIEGPIGAAMHFVYNPHASVNEYSLRYSKAPRGAFIPGVHVMHQVLEEDGVENAEEKAREAVKILRDGRADSLRAYRRLLSLGLTRELARLVLGQDQDTAVVWKMDLYHLSEWVKDGRAQLHTRHPARDIVEAVAEVASYSMPLAWDALMRKDAKEYDFPLPSGSDVIDGALLPLGWEPSETRRPVNRGLEAKLGAPVVILGGAGEMQLVDYMGDEKAMADAARTSYGLGTKTLRDDIKLVISLFRDRHTSPIEMAEIDWEAKSVMHAQPRQLDRHRTMDSSRFLGEVAVGTEFHAPPSEELRVQSTTNKQGRGEELDEILKKEVAAVLRGTLEAQNERAAQLDALGIPEQYGQWQKGVGFVTTQSGTTDIHNALHLFRLRLDGHAQGEVTQTVLPAAEFVEAGFPNLWEAYQDRMNGIEFTASELSLLQQRGLVLPVDSDVLEMPEFYHGDTEETDFRFTTKSGAKVVGRHARSIAQRAERLLPEKSEAPVSKESESSK